MRDKDLRDARLKRASDMRDKNARCEIKNARCKIKNVRCGIKKMRDVRLLRKYQA